MSSSRIVLKPVSSGQKAVEIPVDKTDIGREPLLGCDDEKVSSNHAVLEVTNKKEIDLTTNHVNLCAYQPTTNLKRAVPQKLENNSFSLLPRAYQYQLVINAENSENHQNDLNKQFEKRNDAAAEWRKVFLAIKNEDTRAKKSISNEKFSDENENKCMQAYAHAWMGSMPKDYSELLNSRLQHDVEIMCGKNSITVNKTVLCARSEVFRAMLQSQTGIVKIQDIDFICVQDFVKYLYTNTLPEQLTFYKAKALYEAGNKYAIRGLMAQCSEYLQKNLTLENACECLVLADTYSDRKLKDKVVEYILLSKSYHLDEFWSLYFTSIQK